MPFRGDEKDKLNESSHGYFPINSSTRFRNMVDSHDSLYDVMSPFESKDNPFNHYDHALLDDALDDFMSLPKLSNKNNSSKRLINMINMKQHRKPLFFVQGACPSPTSPLPNQPLLMVQGGYSHDSFSTPNKPIITVQGRNPTKSPYSYARQLTKDSYNTAAHTYNTRNNRQPNPPLVVLTPLLDPQPILPQEPRISQTLGQEYDLFEQLKATPAKISLWDFLQTSSTHHGMLQDSSKTLNVPSAMTSNNMASLIHSIIAPKAQIVFRQDELPSSEVQQQYDPLMIVDIINDSAIRQTLVDNGYGLNVCSINLLHKINVDTSLIKPDSLTIIGFDNVAKSSLGIITLLVKVGQVTLPTPIHVMSTELIYKFLLGRPWIHGIEVVPSTLHRQIKFIHNNTTYTLLGDTRFKACLQTSSSKSSSINSSPTIL